jgi:hypothetical protein
MQVALGMGFLFAIWWQGYFKREVFSEQSLTRFVAHPVMHEINRTATDLTNSKPDICQICDNLRRFLFSVPLLSLEWKSWT